MRISAVIFISVFVSVCFSCKEQAKETDTKPVDSASTKLTNIAKESIKNFAAGDIESFVSQFSEDATFHWSNGKSITGRSELKNYWTERRKKLIKSYSYSGDVWLYSRLQKEDSVYLKGDWVFALLEAEITYSTGKKIKVWMHNDFHFTEDKKIDKMIHYVDHETVGKASSDD